MSRLWQRLKTRRGHTSVSPPLPATSRNGWRSTVTAAAGRELTVPTAHGQRVVTPDGSKNLSDGVLIETTVLARVLRLKLLTLEGTVLVSPAEVRRAGDGSARPGASVRLPPVAVGDRAGPPTVQVSGQVSGDEAIGTRLSAAAARLDDARRMLQDLDDGAPTALGDKHAAADGRSDPTS